MKGLTLTAIFSALLLALSVAPVMAGNGAVGPNQTPTVAKDHEQFIRQAYDLAISAGKKGNHTFGALLVHEGKIILTTENTVYTDKDSTRHAEINLIAKARRDISPKALGESTLYASTAPCMFCCAAMWYSGFKRVVYGVSYDALAELTGFKEKSIPCDKLHEQTDKPLEWIGPVLEKEGLKVFCCWPRDSFQSSLLKKLDCADMGGRCNGEPR